MVLLDVIEHIEDVAVREPVPRMEPGARMLITVPAMPSLYSWWDSALGHYRRYTPPQLEHAASTAGLNRITSHYIFPELIPAAAFRRSRKRSEEAEQAADFPALPKGVDHLLYLVGTATARARRLWPRGTSLMLTAQR